MMEKERALRATLSSIGSVVVAYSGGVDSAYLAFMAHDTLGDRALAVTADSASYPERHRRLALQIADQFRLHHEIVHTGELERADYRANPTNRCYYCKHELYTHLNRIAARRGAVVVDGNNADDRGDYRPGRQAAREFGVRSPLDEVGSRERRRFASCRAVPALPPGTSPRRRVCPRAFRITTRSPMKNFGLIERAEQALRDARLPRLPRAAPRRSRPYRNRSRRIAACAGSRDDAPRSSVSSRRPAIDTSRSIRGISHRQPQRRNAPAARVTPSPRGDRPAVRRRVSRASPPVPSAASLEDLDSINFALGMRDFDVRPSSAASARLPAVYPGGQRRARGGPLGSPRAQPAEHARRRTGGVRARRARSGGSIRPRERPDAPLLATLLAVTPPCTG